MKRFLLVALIAPFLFIGCSHSINSEYNENNLNSISYIAKDKYVRSAVNDLSPLTLHIDIYKVPVLSNGYFDYNNKEFVRTEALDYGEEKEIERCSETGYIYAINCKEYPFLCAWYGYKNELNFFEYENDIVLQKVMYFYSGPNYGVEYSSGSQFAYSNGDGKYFTYNFFGKNRTINCKKYIKEYYQ